MSRDDDPGPDPLPSSARLGTLLFALPPAGRRWSSGLRAAAAFALPALLSAAAGYQDAVLSVVFGAFAVLYGEGRAYRVRARVVGAAGAALLSAVCLGALTGQAVPAGMAGGLAQTALLTAVAVAAVFVIDALRLGPPGALFFVLACAGAMVAARSGQSLLLLLGGTALGVAGSLVAAMAGAIVEPGKPERMAVEAAERATRTYQGLRAQPTAAVARYAAAEAVSSAWEVLYDGGQPDRSPSSPLVARLLAVHRVLAGVGDETGTTTTEMPVARPTIGFRLRRSLSSRSHATVTAVRVAVACASAGTLDAVIGSAHPHWAILAALIVLQTGSDRIRAKVRGIHRLVGTLIGLALFGGLAQLSPTGYELIAILAVLQFATELFVPRNYAVAAVFITPMALFAGGAANTSDLGGLLNDRLVETVIGVALAVSALYLVLPRAHRRTVLWTEQRVRTAAQHLLDRLAESTVEATGMTLRRDLQYELIGCVRGGTEAASNDPRWTAPRWRAHRYLVHEGYDLLGACWTVADDGRVPATERWTRVFGAGY
ncbi:FUSC family protein [Nocardia asteroides]|uniref:FUSC family protein n=1 Tax=Nocardia asteroides TaxID=1824 RepID=UPI0034133BB9